MIHLLDEDYANTSRDRPANLDRDVCCRASARASSCNNSTPVPGRIVSPERVLVEGRTSLRGEENLEVASMVVATWPLQLSPDVIERKENILPRAFGSMRVDHI